MVVGLFPAAEMQAAMSVIGGKADIKYRASNVRF
jgi:hypothetical protein